MSRYQHACIQTPSVTRISILIRTNCEYERSQMYYTIHKNATTNYTETRKQYQLSTTLGQNPI